MGEAVLAVRQTGQPLFAIAYADSCPACRKLRKTLATEVSLRPALKQFVSLAINVEGPDFVQWERRYPRPDGAIPGVYVIAPNGKPVHVSVGAMGAKQLKTMLIESLDTALGQFRSGGGTGASGG